MLVHFLDKDGRDTWINPLQVKAVRDHHGLLGGKKGSEIWLNGLHASIIVPMPPADVAALFDAAMPRNLVVPFDQEDDLPPKGEATNAAM